MSARQNNLIVRINPITGEELHYFKAPPPAQQSHTSDQNKKFLSHEERVGQLINRNDKKDTQQKINYSETKKDDASNRTYDSSLAANASSIPLLNFSELLNSDANRSSKIEHELVQNQAKLNDFKNQNPIIAPQILEKAQSARPVSSYRHGYQNNVTALNSPLINYQKELENFDLKFYDRIKEETPPSKINAPRELSFNINDQIDALIKPAIEKKNSIYKVERVGDLEKLWLSMTPMSDLINNRHLMQQEDKSKDLKEKLVIDTVLTDQLSRFALSDPTQTESLTNRKNNMPLKTIFTNQGNKFTLVQRRQNLDDKTANLSKRCKFNCRVRSPNGKIALRELFGIFFLHDSSLTIYEFRLLCGAYLTGVGSGNMSKKANALPFLNRRAYKHAFGRRMGLNIDIWDIFKGSILYIPLEGQASLPDQLRGQEYIEIEILDVDELEKENLLVSFYLNNASLSSDEMNSNILTIKEKLKQPLTNVEINDIKIINSVRLFLRKQVETRSVEVYMGISVLLKKISAQNNNNGLISKQEFCDALLEYNVLIHSEDVNIVWQLIDLNLRGYLNYYSLMRMYFGQMNATRHAHFRSLILKLDTQKIGYVQVNDIYKYYKAAKHPKVRQGEMSVSDMFNTYLNSFNLLDPSKLNDLNELSTTTSMDNTKSLLISYEQLEDYYNGLSICVDSDADFIQILQNSWSI